MGNGTTPGANPAPHYKEKSNAIAALMSRHTSSSSLSFLSSLPRHSSSSSSSAAPLKKTPAQLAAEAEDYELDRMAQHDDNMGVGMFAPENRTKTDEGRRREHEDRKLKARLGLAGKRKGSEWEAVSGVSRAREAAASDDEDMGRSGVGRAKKRKRIVPVVEGPEAEEDFETAQSTKPESIEAAEPEAGDDIADSKEATIDTPTMPEAGLKTGTTTDQDSAADANAKNRRKKKKRKNKSAGQVKGITSS
ncbi:hypothetical protein KJ359_010511 [Pestalotiopsis sp. 9143b]|nr:hypothetical protein KJ359_010511 [Pestalotiopsis sp. 9143b]